MFEPPGNRTLDFYFYFIILNNRSLFWKGKAPWYLICAVFCCWRQLQNVGWRLCNTRKHSKSSESQKEVVFFLALICTHILFCAFLSIKFVCKNIPTVLIEKTQVLVKTTHCCPILLFVLCPLNSCITLCGDFTTGPFSLHTGVIYFAILTQGWSLAEMFHTVYEGTQVQGVYMCQYAFVLGITLK